MKIVSVVNYTKINHYTITLVQVFWNSAKRKLPQISKLHIKETQTQDIYTVPLIQNRFSDLWNYNTVYTTLRDLG